MHGESETESYCLLLLPSTTALLLQAIGPGMQGLVPALGGELQPTPAEDRAAAHRAAALAAVPEALAQLRGRAGGAWAGLLPKEFAFSEHHYHHHQVCTGGCVAAPTPLSRCCLLPPQRCTVQAGVAVSRFGLVCLSPSHWVQLLSGLTAEQLACTWQQHAARA